VVDDKSPDADAGPDNEEPLDTAIKESVRFSEEDAHDPLMALSGV
jgi:hypothetical protein